MDILGSRQGAVVVLSVHQEAQAGLLGAAHRCRPPRAVDHGPMLLPAQPKQGNDPDCSLGEVEHSLTVRQKQTAGAVAADQGPRLLALVSGFQPEQSNT